MTVGGTFRDLVHEHFNYLHGDFIRSGIVVAEFRIIPGDLIIHRQPPFIPNRLDAGVLDGREAVRHYRQSGDAAGTGAEDFVVMKSHLNFLIAVFIVHIVDDIQCVDIQLSEPVADGVKFFDYIVKFQLFTPAGQKFGSDLLSGNFIPAAVDSVQQSFRQVGSGAKKLHLLSYPHSGNTASDGVIVSEFFPHQVVAFVLDRGGLDRQPGGEPLKVFRKAAAP